MDYCLGDGDGSATMWSGELNVDVDGDGVFDAIGLDFDGDGRLDDALTDTDGDGTADHLLLDVDDDGQPEASFTDDGSGTWTAGAPIRWLGLDGAASTGGPLVDFDGDGQVDDRVVDANRDGLADRVLVGDDAYVDVDADGRWDLKLTDSDSDGAADAASQL